MFKSIVQCYARNKQNKLKYFLLRISSAIIFVITVSKIANYVINDLIFKTPKPDLSINESSSNFIYSIFNKEGFVFFLFVILCLFLIDFFSYKKNNSTKKWGSGAKK